MQTDQDKEERIVCWIEADDLRMAALRAAASLGLNDWCIAAGFVRNLVWDQLHGISAYTPLNDIDLIYFDPADTNETRDKALESELEQLISMPWSVKNQARMHIRNRDAPYCSTTDAMSFWVEVETAVGARLSSRGEVEIVSAFGVQSLFTKSITINSKRRKESDFLARIESKRWLDHWPELEIVLE
ncbi:MAG: nucleotidyltransferase family protein [Pseudomonadota bacterium]